MAGTDTKNNNYPMCGAKTRTNGRCRQRAMQNGRCYLHGGKSRAGREHGRYKTGFFTKESIAYRREMREFFQMVKRSLQAF